MKVLILNKNNQLTNLINTPTMKPHYKNLNFLKTFPFTIPMTKEIENNHLIFFYQNIAYNNDAYLNSGEVASAVCKSLYLDSSRHGLVGSLLLDLLQRTNPTTVGLSNNTVIIGSKGLGEKCFHYFPKKI